ncbi:hypothetical protein A1F94_006483 [Pyrenophora tritici-repentis]|uniref:Protamine-P2 multi-domain protein n=1 Tax=Pyrenophora tritici-repentis TaxID=45151 RepID=A0A2W1DGQ1_9PLEO|nr:hypothetical protein A1F99_087940 [Pyrenophora tritici-repentis]KAF7569713.1 Protamine-P2 multi-domain protein [Pyrenophora tritici-repentis]KAG9382562.1 hypothetical protein A1F94_006483 [Pyrenophora tritici-repentis]KAI0573703.1 hypothetical protein Alg130_09984 [Pyrenophora tritici-repentis]KAI0576937.1 hypothetical protein Alg215_07211 [Pyrenophora tritici-repentis]
MKFLTLTFILTLATTALAAAVVKPLNTAFSIVVRDANCDACFEQYKFCQRNGHTDGEEGCNQTCAEHVCHMNRYDGADPRECRGCGGAFDMCPEKSRYI